MAPQRRPQRWRPRGPPQLRAAGARGRPDEQPPRPTGRVGVWGSRPAAPETRASPCATGGWWCAPTDSVCACVCARKMMGRGLASDGCKGGLSRAGACGGGGIPARSSLMAAGAAQRRLMGRVQMTKNCIRVSTPRSRCRASALPSPTKALDDALRSSGLAPRQSRGPCAMGNQKGPSWSALHGASQCVSTVLVCLT